MLRPYKPVLLWLLGQRSEGSQPAPREERSPSPWETLGVRPGASREEITTAYRALVRQWHPDRVPVDAAAELRELATRRTAAINAAYDTLAGVVRR